MKKLIIIAAVMLAAITSVQAQENATVLIARKGLYSGAKKNVAIYMDDKQIAEIANGQYVAVSVPAGSHKFFGQWYSGKAKKQDEAVEIELQPGKEYYLRAVREERGAVAIVAVEEITASSWSKLKDDLKEKKD